MHSVYSLQPLTRKHDPSGYVRYKTYKPWLRDEFSFRCAYCLDREQWYPSGHNGFGTDHFEAQVNAPSRICDYTNLYYVCNQCNSICQEVLLPLDPCKDALGSHLQFNADGSITDLTPEGKKFIRILRLDDPQREAFRHDLWLLLEFLDKAGTPEARDRVKYKLGFPNNLPDLSRLRPPGGNSKPEGIDKSFLKLQRKGLLPETY